MVRQPTTWTATFEVLAERSRAGSITAEELEQLATAAYMIGDDAACERAWIEAHHAWLEADQPARAARCAFWQALGLFFRGDLAPALGWVSRGARVLDRVDEECVEQVWGRMLTALPQLFSGDASTYSTYTDALGTAEALRDGDAAMFARMCAGYALILQERLPEGMHLLDETMVAVTAGEVGPLLSGIGYCQVITLCRTAFDLRRAREWTYALSRWCDDQPDLVPFRGNCLVHRCEIFQLDGSWKEAMEAAQNACALLAGPPTWDFLGSAYYQLGEMHRLRGEEGLAEAAYRQASQAGRDPQPGAALLLMAQGRHDLALATLRRARAELTSTSDLAVLLPALVDVALEAGDIAGAREAADELAGIAETLDAAYVHAASTHATGAVLLAQDDAATAIGVLRHAQRRWWELKAPYEAARVQALLGSALRSLGDEASAAVELEAASAAFDALGAQPDVRRLSRVEDHNAFAGLSPRETEVLRLVATGRTNRAVAKELSITEKTVARHLANIFSKLGLSSRAEATAWAFQRGLAR